MTVSLVRNEASVMPEVQEGLLDPEALVKRNGVADGQALQTRGFLSVPSHDGGTLTLDLREPYRNRELLIEEYWRFHPRYAFIKALAANARLVDVGAGSGGTIGWKEWGAPSRSDIFMYAVDRAKGEHFDRFVDYDIVDLERDEMKFPDGAFDAILCSHVIDFLRDRDVLAREVARICRPGGRIYIEWPNSESDRILSKFAFSPFGIGCGTLSIEDDPEQVASIGRNEVLALFEEAGTRPLMDGVIFNDYLAQELFRCGVAERNEEATTYGLSLALRLARFFIFEKT